MSLSTKCMPGPRGETPRFWYQYQQQNQHIFAVSSLFPWSAVCWTHLCIRHGVQTSNTIKGYMGMSVTFTLVELAVSLAGWLSQAGWSNARFFSLYLKALTYWMLLSIEGTFHHWHANLYLFISAVCIKKKTFCWGRQSSIDKPSPVHFYNFKFKHTYSLHTHT
jgi:hypothetical protein